MEPTIPSSVLTPFPENQKERVACLLDEAFRASVQKIVVLDDDPTGVQTVHDVSVYTDWSQESLREGFAEPGRLFFLLTNSRGFPAAKTADVHAVIAARVAQAARESGKDFLLVSRGDSTLRGHYPLETDVISQELARQGLPVDGELICPYFRAGGRFTLNDTHYVRVGDLLVPAAQTEFARDATFGYAHSDLKDYIAEKTLGRYPAREVRSLSLEELRAVDLDGITAKLESLRNGAKLIVNATDDWDLKVLCIALYRALARGKRFCYRTAASFIKAVGNLDDRPLLRREEMLPVGGEVGGLVVVGSHTQKTTAQLDSLLRLDRVHSVSLNSDLVLTPGALEEEARAVAQACDALLRQGVTPVVSTRRAVLSLPDDTPEAALLRSVRISDAVQSVVSLLQVAPAFLIAKGGITSSDIGTRALRVRRATVLGQLCPGVPVWQTGPESRFPGIPYVIFPGNVGEADSLRDAVRTLLG